MKFDINRSVFMIVAVTFTVFCSCKKDGGGKDNNGGTTKQAYVPDLAGSYSYLEQGGTLRIPHTLRVQKDGKILALGYKLFVRLEKDGVTVDNSFRPSNEIVSEVTGIDGSFVLQDDGKIIVFGPFGLADGRKWIIRLNTDGSLDNTFNNPKIDKIGSPVSISGMPISSVHLLAGGKMIIAGRVSYTTPNSFGLAVARLNADQSLDYTFSSPFAAGEVYGPGKLLPLADGSMLLAGSNGLLRTKDGGRYAVIKINADGEQDNSFFYKSELADHLLSMGDMIQLRDGKILVGISPYYPYFTGSLYSVEMLNADGSVNTSFNEYSNGGSIKSLLQLPNGNIFIGGVSGSMRPSADCAILLNAAGVRDTSFHLTFSKENAAVYSAVSLNNNTLLLGGYFELNDKAYSLLRLAKNR